MEVLKSLIIILMGSVLVNNYVLSRFLGICPFLGVSKKLDQATGMGISVIFVMLVATAATWPIQRYILDKFGLGYLQTIVFILVIATLVQFIEIVLKKFIPSLHKSLGVYLPLITTNCAVLGVTINNITDGYNFLESMVSALGCGLGFLLAMVLFSGVRQRMEGADIPAAFRGLPVTLLAASIVSLAFLGFAGIVKMPKKEQVSAVVEAGSNGLTSEILSALIVLLATGILASVILILASHYMSVPTDPKREEARACLPGANCGACGYTGCDGYAEALVEGEACNLCVPGGADTAKALAEIFGGDASAADPMRAYVHCNGTDDATETAAEYEGLRTCAAMCLTCGGPERCKFGCLGCLDCASVCPTGAISFENGIASIDPDVCIGCGKCVKTCPKHIISMIPKSAKVAVACSSCDGGAQTRKNCKNGCIACKKCEKACPNGAITVVNNLSVIDYSKCTGCGACSEACPVKCIEQL